MSLQKNWLFKRHIFLYKIREKAVYSKVNNYYNLKTLTEHHTTGILI